MCGKGVPHCLARPAVMQDSDLFPRKQSGGGAVQAVFCQGEGPHYPIR